MENPAHYYKGKIDEVLNRNMTEKCFKLWEGLNKLLPQTYDKSTSSTGKHHKKLNGEIPSQAEHIYHLVYSADKLIRMFNIEPKTNESDVIFLALVIHDSLKYGEFGSRKFSDKTHDKQAADMIEANREALLKIFSDDQVSVLSEMVRFHSGQWSTDVQPNEKFSFKNYHPFTFFIHMLDMMSTHDLIQTDVRE
jgi:hypothetical protein